MVGGRRVLVAVVFVIVAIVIVVAVAFVALVVCIIVVRTAYYQRQRLLRDVATDKLNLAAVIPIVARYRAGAFAGRIRKIRHIVVLAYCQLKMEATCSMQVATVSMLCDKCVVECMLLLLSSYVLRKNTKMY